MENDNEIHFEKDFDSWSYLVDNSDDFDGEDAVAATRVVVEASCRKLEVFPTDHEQLKIKISSTITKMKNGPNTKMYLKVVAEYNKK